MPEHESRPTVVLVGPMGAGKSTVGSLLAARLEVGYRDTDLDVETVAGKPVSDIFTDDGEREFRTLERAAVLAALAEHAGVLALGGGAIMDEHTRAALSGHFVVFLSLTMPIGVRRTGLASNRPLLVGVNPRATYKALLDARLPLYREVATVEIDTDDLTVDQVTDEIATRLAASTEPNAPMTATSARTHPAGPVVPAPTTQ